MFKAQASSTFGDGLLPDAAPLNSEINVTPFVDVMLVLLIIFMVAAPMLTVGVPIDLPKAALEQLPPEDKPLDIFIQKDGQIFFGDVPVAIEAVEIHVAGLEVAQREGRVRLRADQAVPYERLIALVEVLSKNGINKIGLVAAPKVDGALP